MAAQALAAFTSSVEVRDDIRRDRKGQSLADLGWMDGSKGDSVNNILDFADSEDAYTVLCALEALIQRHWKEKPGHWTGVENIIIAVMALMREVGNGGFDQFYRNSSKRWAFFASSALLHIGRKDAAKIARRATRALGRIGDKPFEELDQKMSRSNDRRDAVFEECDAAFYELSGLPESLLNYARGNRTGILPES